MHQSFFRYTFCPHKYAHIRKIDQHKFGYALYIEYIWIRRYISVTKSFRKQSILITLCITSFCHVKPLRSPIHHEGGHDRSLSVCYICLDMWFDRHPSRCFPSIWMLYMCTLNSPSSTDYERVDFTSFSFRFALFFIVVDHSLSCKDGRKTKCSRSQDQAHAHASRLSLMIYPRQ